MIYLTVAMGRNNYRQQNYTLNRGNGNDGQRKYNGHTQHDDRGADNSEGGGGGGEGGGGGRGGYNKVWNRLGQRQVSFGDDEGGKRIEGSRRGGGISKKNSRGKYNKQIHVEHILHEDDEDMGRERGGDQAGRGRPLPGRGTRGRYRGYRGGPGRTPPGIIVGRNASAASIFSWHKVVLKNGHKYEKIALLKELLARCSVKFIPICYTKQAMNTYFYLEDQTAARALKELDRQIEMPDGFQLQINIERTTPPNMPLTEELVDKIKVVMSKRYIAEHKALNLKSFHTDEGFAGESFYAPLWRSNVMNKVLTVIIDNIPELKAIDLSNNKLNSSSLDFFSTFKSKAKDLTILYLADNKIGDTKAFERMKGLELIDLKLTGNPIVTNLGSSYTASIRKIFPKLQLLDGKELPKEIGFDDDEPTTSSDLPASIPKMLKNEAASGVVLTFLEQFFKLYDSDNRQPLLDAYHESAMFSLSAQGRHELLSAYIPESRNLKRVDYEKKRHELLRRGRLSVVAFLSKLPKTEHDMNTFTLDVPFTSESLMTFTVTGCFRERGTKQNNIKHFNRCFLVVPQNSGFCIINETLFVSAATDLSTRKAFINPPPSIAAAPAAVPDVDPAAKQSLALAFSEKSGMNIQFSAKCLEENCWDFDKAAAVFSEAKAKGIVPPEAYAK